MPPPDPQPAPPRTLRYQVDAVQVPIVYTLDGDHDGDGLMFSLRAYRPLIQWLKDRWTEYDKLLPTLHERCQRIQIVVDGLARYELMRERLTALGQDLDLLVELGGEASDAGADEDRDDERHLSPTSRTRRQNYRDLVSQLVVNLDELTDGAVTAIDPDAGVRAAWRQAWAVALDQAEDALDAWFTALEADPARRFDPDALAAQARADGDVDAADSVLTADRIRRLMLNDHRSAVWPPTDVDPAAVPGRPDPHHYDRCNPLKPMDLIRPLVLRARAGDRVEVTLHNRLTNRSVGLHRQGGGLAGGRPAADGGAIDLTDGVEGGDGAAVGTNDPSLAPPGGAWHYVWHPLEEGVWPINDLGDVRGTEAGTNSHGLFGALIVEPEGATWRDPETGERLLGTDCADGLYMDVIVAGEDITDPRHEHFVDFHLGPDNQPGDELIPRSHREYAIFIHDEPEVHSALHAGEHTVMPLSYRAEPMENRLPHRMRRYAEATPAEPAPDQEGVDQKAVMWEIDDDLTEVFRVARTPDGRWLERVAGEEQHHSSWLFGDPVTPLLRAYKGDPARIRLVHAGVKETHVYHLHVHQWRAVPQDTAGPSVWRPGEHKGSQLLDSITIGPQTAVTIDPLYGAGSRQHLFGDVIWHCHLYPHFHHGMWGLWRSYDRLVEGDRALPDGTPTRPLLPLPGRDPDRPTAQHPGFPWFMDATFPQKSPPPPAIRPQDRVGRRQLLEMPLHSPLEWEAFDPGCRARPHSGALFVDLDGLAAEWNAAAGLGPPRVVSYDVEVVEEPTVYNSNGWHDLHGHRYQLTGVTTIELDADGNEVTTVHPLPPAGDPEPFFPRANHGDIVEWRLHNRLPSIRPDDYDLPTPPVECGLHVHLVKFDVLAADGSSTGFNYLSGASCPEAVGQAAPGQPARNVGLHRWVVDEEFGPCFFHDHLLANYRQKRGLFAALVAEPPGSQWTRPDQETIAWAGTQAVVWPGADTGEAAYREACLGIGDFIPLYDGRGEPLNAPGTLSSDEDPGSMGVNYRSTPLTYRGDDPSAWFSSAGDGADPDTPIIETYAGERLRLRLIQGSHEEQHSFVLNGLRWRKEWHNPASPVVNQQTIGISEAFTFEIERHEETTEAGARYHLSYGPGDHLWSFTAMDDLWLGCWGLIRALAPGDDPDLPMLPGTAAPVPPARAVPPRPPDGDPSIREYTVVALRTEHRFHGTNLTDPWGLIYRVQAVNGANVDSEGDEPLVIRARPGEWVKVTLRNEVVPPEDAPPNLIDPPFGPETAPPPLPIERLDRLGRPAERTVSPRVSLHPSLLRYDVVTDDGSWVGRNHDSTVASRQPRAGHGGHLETGGVVYRSHHGGFGSGAPITRTYWWYVDHELGPASHAGGPGRVCYLHDLADIRNHRHHGLIGALVVEPGDCVPVDPETGDERWHGTTVVLVSEDDPTVVVAHETVLLVQDGLRHFVAGNPALPVADIVPGDDPEDAGQKAINYRAAMVHPAEVLHSADPPTPIWSVPAGTPLWLRLVGAADKPRNHTFTVHGVSWSSAPWQDGGPRVDSLSGLTGGVTHDLVFTAEHPGDHAYRSGVFRWAVENGLWGIIRVSRGA